MKFLVYTAPYNENVGGFIVLHKLCHLLNRGGHRAYLCPVGRKARLLMQMHRNPAFCTPLLPFGVDLSPSTSITIYPEVVDGNPLRARNVVRWFLHHPGFFTGKTVFGADEFHVSFGDLMMEAPNRRFGSHLSQSPLTVWHIPTEHYNLDGAVPLDERIGSAYCIRKAQSPDMSMVPDGSICVDGEPHSRIASICKKVKYFYSFDPHTLYSRLAALCGAVSIVVPTPQMTAELWHRGRTQETRLGVGFGVDDEQWAISSVPRLRQWVQEQESKSASSVSRFAADVTRFFMESEK